MQQAQRIVSRNSNGFLIVNNNETENVGGRHFEKAFNKDYDRSLIWQTLHTIQRNEGRMQLSLVHAGEPCTSAIDDGDAPTQYDRYWWLGISGRALGGSYFSCTTGGSSRPAG